MSYSILHQLPENLVLKLGTVNNWKDKHPHVPYFTNAGCTSISETCLPRSAANLVSSAKNACIICFKILAHHWRKPCTWAHLNSRISSSCHSVHRNYDPVTWARRPNSFRLCTSFIFPFQFSTNFVFYVWPRPLIVSINPCYLFHN